MSRERIVELLAERDRLNALLLDLPRQLNALQKQINAIVNVEAGLTARQVQVLVLVRQEKLNKQIAGDLNIGIRTVKYHVEKLMKHYKVKSRRDL